MISVKLLVRRSLLPGLCLLLGMGAGHLLTRSYSVESALQGARQECERELHGNADFSQLELNICSSFLRRLAEMELAWRRIDVENSASYARLKVEGRGDFILFGLSKVTEVGTELGRGWAR